MRDTKINNILFTRICIKTYNLKNVTKRMFIKRFNERINTNTIIVVQEFTTTRKSRVLSIVVNNEFHNSPHVLFTCKCVI